MYSDCEYYLNYGNRNKKILWAGDEKEHIENMLLIYNSFDEKPEWLTIEQIEKYKELMIIE
jgi:hypothetical protein